MPTSFSYRQLASLTLWLTYILIIVGGATRVYDAGMACPDWPHCYGYYIPFPESKIPGGYIVDGQHYVWWQVLLEWGHRALASLVGFALLALVMIHIKSRRAMHHERLPLIAAVVLLIIQVGLGGLTVLKSNIHWSVVLHLGNAMLFFGALVWLRRTVAAEGKKNPIHTPLWFTMLLVGFAIIVWMTMLIGAFVSSSHSGGVCGGLFSCAGQWMPSPKVDLGQHIHMQHRLYALLTVALSIAVLVAAKRKAPALRQSALHAHLMVWGQVALGVLTLYSFASYPEYYYPLSIAHLAWGTLLWLAALGVMLNRVYGSHGRFHG